MAAQIRHNMPPLKQQHGVTEKKAGSHTKGHFCDETQPNEVEGVFSAPSPLKVTSLLFFLSISAWTGGVTGDA